MLVTIIDTKTQGKFILHSYPYLNVKSLTGSLTQFFQNFGFYFKQHLICTSRGDLSEKTILDIFLANPKYSQIVMGLDDDCFLVSKSAFGSQSDEPQKKLQGFVSENVQIVDSKETIPSVVNSISVIKREHSQARLEEVKHKLAFLVGALLQKQRIDGFITQAVFCVSQGKKAIQKKLKSMNKTNSEIQLFEYAQNVIKSIPMFSFLQRYYRNCFEQGIQMRVDEWQSTIGSSLCVEWDRNAKELIPQYKTAVIDVKQLKSKLPSVMYNEQVQKLIHKALQNNNRSLKEACKSTLPIAYNSIKYQQLQHTTNFLLRNNLTVPVYPIHRRKYYNIFTLIKLPLQYQNYNALQPYSTYHILKQEDSEWKELLTKRIVKEVKIYISKKITPSVCQPMNKLPNLYPTALLEKIAKTYAMTPYDINYIISQENISSDELISFVRQSSLYDFYYVE